MNKKDVIAEVACKTGYSQDVVSKVLEELAESIAVELSYGGGVVIKGFGTFRAKKRAARVGRNIGTGESMTIPERYVVAFKPSKALREAVAGLR